jgi:hypothetical protein
VGVCIETRMKNALIALGFLNVLTVAPDVTSAQSSVTPSRTFDGAGVHSAVVDIPEVPSLPPMSPVAWETFWNHIPPPVQTGQWRELGPAAAPSRLNSREHLEVDSETPLRLPKLVELVKFAL